MQSLYRIEMDFRSDWSNYQMKELKRMGYEIGSLDTNEISLKYFNLLKRYISSVPRKIHFAQNFECPKSLKEGFNVLIRKIKHGEEINPNLSRNLKKIDYKDMLLNDWGIHHLHLGVEIDDDGFVNRDRKKTDSNYVLFVRFTDSDAYLIKIGKHGEWGDDSLVQLIHDSWPDTIESCKINGISTRKINNKQRQEARKAGSLTAISVEDGTVYYPIGMGYTTAGTSIEALKSSDGMLDLIDSFEDSIKENINHIIKTFKKAELQIHEELKFILQFENEELYAREVNSNGIVLMNSIE